MRQLSATPVIAGGSVSFALLPQDLPFVLATASTKIYCQLVCTNAVPPTYAAADDPTVKLVIERA